MIINVLNDTVKCVKDIWKKKKSTYFMFHVIMLRVWNSRNWAWSAMGQVDGTFPLNIATLHGRLDISVSVTIRVCLRNTVRLVLEHIIK